MCVIVCVSVYTLEVKLALLPFNLQHTFFTDIETNIFGWKLAKFKSGYYQKKRWKIASGENKILTRTYAKYFYAYTHECASVWVWGEIRLNRARFDMRVSVFSRSQ